MGGKRVASRLPCEVEFTSVSQSRVFSVAGGAGADADAGEAEDGNPLRFASATTCLTRLSNRAIRSLRLAFSLSRLDAVLSPKVRDWVTMTGEGGLMTGLTSRSRSAGGGATLARLTPPDELTISGGMPRSLASEMTFCAGEDSLSADDGDARGGGVSPARSALFSASSSLTRCSK